MTSPLEQITSDSRKLEQKGRGITRREFLIGSVVLAALGVGSYFGLRGGNSAPPATQQVMQPVQVGTPLQFEDFGMRWGHDAGEGIDSLVYNDGSAYYTRSNVVYILDGTTGAKREIVTGAYPKLSIHPHIFKDKLIFVPIARCSSLYIYIYILETGTKMLETPADLGLFHTTLNISQDGIIYAVGYDEKEKTALFAFSSQDGKEVFRMELSGIVPIRPEAMYLIGDDLIFNTGFGIYAIDTKTKSLKWKYVGQGGGNATIFDSVRDGNILYFASRRVLGESVFPSRMESHQSIKALDLQTGKDKWVFDIKKDNANSFAIHKFLGDATTYVTVHMDSGKDYVLDGGNGAVLKSMPSAGYPLPSIVFFDNVAYTIDNGRILALDPNNARTLREYKAESMEGKILGIDRNGFYLRAGNSIRAFGEKK